jgi:hypothetical protein
MAISALHLASLLALDLTALAVAACCLHVRAAHGIEPGVVARGAAVAAVLAVVVNGMVDRDLAQAALLDLALLLSVVAPIAAPSRR